MKYEYTKMKIGVENIWLESRQVSTPVKVLETMQDLLKHPSIGAY